MKGIQSNGFLPIIAQAIAEMEEIHGEFSSIDEINLAELGRRTGLSRSKLRRLKANGFCEKVHGLNGQKKERILDGYSSVLDTLLKSGVSNSTVCLERLQAVNALLGCSPCNARRSDPADSPLAGNTPALFSSNTPPAFPSIFL